MIDSELYCVLVVSGTVSKIHDLDKSDSDGVSGVCCPDANDLTLGFLVCFF